MKVERLPVDVDRETFVEVGAFLVKESRAALARRGVQVPVDVNAATKAGWRAASEGMTFIARNEAGQLIGSIAMVDAPLYWMCDPARRCIVDMWFVVAEDARDGTVERALRAAVAGLAKEKGLPAFIIRRVPVLD